MMEISASNPAGTNRPRPDYYDLLLPSRWSDPDEYFMPLYYEPPAPRRMKMSVDSYNLKTPHLSMVPATAMLFRDELKRAFSTLERTRIEPEILPPEVNIRIPLINYTSLAYTPYELANELFLHVEDLWTKHLRIISEEAQDYHARHGFYPWEEESASGSGDAAAAPATAPKADPPPPAKAKNMPAGPPDPDPGTNMLGYLFYGENAWIGELDWGAIKNDLREIKESLLAQAVVLLQGLQQTLARAEDRETAAGAGESFANPEVAPGTESSVEQESSLLDTLMDLFMPKAAEARSFTAEGVMKARSFTTEKPINKNLSGAKQDLFKDNAQGPLVKLRDFRSQQNTWLEHDSQIIYFLFTYDPQNLRQPWKNQAWANFYDPETVAVLLRNPSFSPGEKVILGHQLESAVKNGADIPRFEELQELFQAHPLSE